MRRHQKYNLKLLKIAIDAQKNEDCCSRILRIKNGSNPVFEPNILAGVEGHIRLADCLLDDRTQACSTRLHINFAKNDYQSFS